MKTQLLIAVLALDAVCAFSQTPTPPPPPDDAKPTHKHDPSAEVQASKGYKDARTVAILLNSFAQDNGGKLPQKLQELVPAYLSDKTLLPELEFKTPGAELAKLAPDTVVLNHVRDARIAITAGQLQGVKTVPR